MSDEDDGVCKIAFESALRKADEMCDDPEALEQATRPFFGLERGGDTDCTQVLVTGIGPKSSASDTREWVHCRANKIVREDDISIADAISQAWDEAEEKTAEDLPDYDELFGSDSTDDGADDVDMGLTDPDLELGDSAIIED